MNKITGLIVFSGIELLLACLFYIPINKPGDAAFCLAASFWAMLLQLHLNTRKD